MKEFIDSHCHIFNIVDIPLYETIQGKVNFNTFSKLFFVPLAGGLYAANKIKEIEKKKDFIKFFERSLEESIFKFEKHLLDLTGGNTDILITPLIMDFDYVKEDGDNFSNLKAQTERLLNAVDKASAKLKIKICPFIGFDLRKLRYADGLQQIQNLWKTYGSSPQNTTIKEIKNGSILGIKLYPPMGFNPYPANKERYLEFYRWCIEKDIPITVHCQEGSYGGGSTKKEIKNFTNPLNWLKLFSDNPDLKNLKINFAHFGGEDGVEDMLDPLKFWVGGIDKNSWTYTIIKLLQKYPNTYSDISGYNYGKDKLNDFSSNLRKVIEFDYKGQFTEGEFRLKDKLLWGSDVPMVLSEDSYEGHYKNYFNQFDKVVKSASISNLHKKEFLENLVMNNPKEFLNLK
ncbi:MULTISPECIES: amidohydrolase family protein [Psychrilyobacter]|uniref:Amidohydrolase-related domain-containing protein n=1 Tax=Psychrilyobacter piezotolerans TaxID=2293438 RepID=A0ABX9KDN1_9FUSO|nr:MULTISPECIES: amidohydrolase family protein [Psychrilyobacter]MCS5422194.1 amidohydrolase [Psychrilyobacter sp. S5]NDI77698.1 amidohydrolase family protein [Psychrilyobacter piezotolerans]RDE59085.1 hypothetical protein DV867_14005 [Psychrilyobacter sp. S5]REI39657.1 hypothetical protein DYH56_14005 [Psychrilyobacter piezotolerans]